MYYYYNEPTLGDKIKNFFEFLGELFISIHTMGFEMIGDYSRNAYWLGQGYAIIHVILGILLIIVVLILDLFILFLIYSLIYCIWIKVRTKEIKQTQVTGKVVKKSYHSAHTTMVPVMAGKVTVMSPRHCPEKFNVVVQYQDITETFDDELLYSNFKENDDIVVILVEKLDRHGKLIEATLSLLE